ncbi:hypothetical protein D3C75_784880 [compost metagenome]
MNSLAEAPAERVDSSFVPSPLYRITGPATLLLRTTLRLKVILIAGFRLTDSLRSAGERASMPNPLTSLVV